MISSRAAPTFKEPNRWSQDMKDFLSHCLIKDCDKRYSAAELLKHNWIRKTVVKIGANGSGLPELEELMADNWDVLERIRASRCKVPDNIMLPEVEQLAEDAGIAVVASEPDTPTIRRTTSSAAAAVLTEVSIESDLSINSNLSMVRKHSYGVGGIAATRQQLRNASLHRSHFPNNNLHNNNLNLNSSMLNQSFTAGGTMIRNNNPTLASSSADAFDQGGTFVVRPLHGAQVQNDWQQTSSSVIRVDSNAQTKEVADNDNYRPSNNNNGTFRQSTFLTSIDRYYDSSSMVKVTANDLHGSPSSSFVQRPHDTPSPSSRLENKNNIQAALRYFRNDPMTPPTNPVPIAEEKTTSPYQNNPLKSPGETKELSSGGSEKVSPKTDSANKPPAMPFANRKLPPVPVPPPPLPSTAQAEAALLDELANAADNTTNSRRDFLDDERRDFMKKVCAYQCRSILFAHNLRAF